MQMNVCAAEMRCRRRVLPHTDFVVASLSSTNLNALSEAGE